MRDKDMILERIMTKVREVQGINMISGTKNFKISKKASTKLKAAKPVSSLDSD